MLRSRKEIDTKVQEVEPQQEKEDKPTSKSRTSSKSLILSEAINVPPPYPMVLKK